MTYIIVFCLVTIFVVLLVTFLLYAKNKVTAISYGIYACIFILASGIIACMVYNKFSTGAAAGGIRLICYFAAAILVLIVVVAAARALTSARRKAAGKNTAEAVEKAGKTAPKAELKPFRRTLNTGAPALEAYAGEKAARNYAGTAVSGEAQLFRRKLATAHAEYNAEAVEEETVEAAEEETTEEAEEETAEAAEEETAEAVGEETAEAAEEETAEADKYDKMLAKADEFRKNKRFKMAKLLYRECINTCGDTAKVKAADSKLLLCYTDAKEKTRAKEFINELLSSGRYSDAEKNRLNAVLKIIDGRI